MSTAALSWAVRLALDVETCRSLMLGEPVEPARLDQGWLEVAKEFQLVTLDVVALDAFHSSLGEEQVAA
jgi:hypothetical protein